MLVEEAVSELDDVAFDLIAEASQLGGRIHPILQESVGSLVRSTNCYYSETIGGWILSRLGTSSNLSALSQRVRRARMGGRLRETDGAGHSATRVLQWSNRTPATTTLSRLHDHFAPLF